MLRFVKPTVVIKKGKEKSLLNRHPWVLAGAVIETKGQPRKGDIVRVSASQGNTVGWGFFNPDSSIPVRLFSWGNSPPAPAFWKTFLESAIQRRVFMCNDAHTTAYRLVFSESDRLPGLIVDRYGAYLVLQTLNPGMERLKHEIASHLLKRLPVKGILEKNDSDVRSREGLPLRTEVLLGQFPLEPFEILENGNRFLIDPVGGQKTGFYLDQRDNRLLVSRYAKNRVLLDAFSYTGAFSVYAARQGAASLTRVDTSQTALDWGRKNLDLNNLTDLPDETIRGNVFQVLRKFRDERRRFDMIILDPPKLAATKAQREKAFRGYKDINLLALKLLEPGGILATFSCSGGVDMTTFQRVLAWAAKDARRTVQILHRLHQGPDHPVLLSFPEAAYLKGFLCRVE